jgi:hypothetical protein
MSEHDLRQTFHRALRPFGIVQPLESPIVSGIPDELCLLNMTPELPYRAFSSLVELKHEHAWPKRPDTPLRLKKFSIDQLRWLEAWHRTGGRCCVMLQVADDYLLIPPVHLATLAIGATRDDLMKLAAVVGHAAFPTKRVLKWLTS